MTSIERSSAINRERLGEIMADFERRVAAAGERVRIDTAVCTGCGRCVEACPTDVLRVDVETAKAYPAYPADCCVCFLCQSECPVDCLTVEMTLSPRGFRSIYDIMDINLDA